MLTNVDYTFLKYNAIDSDVMMKARSEFWAEIENNPGYLWTYNHTERLVEPLIFMMMKGIRVDEDNVRKISGELEKEINETQEKLQKIVGRSLPATFSNSSKQCQAYFYGELGITPYYKDKRVTTDDKALARIARGTSTRKPVPAAKLVQKIRGLRKLKGTYMDIIFDTDGRMRCDCKPRGTRFGRISTSKTIRATGMNMQNLPVQFKKYMLADKDKVLVEIDKSGAEWVVTAFLAKDANMLNVIESGESPHVHTAHLMFKSPKELVEEEHELIGNETDFELIAEKRKQIPALRALPFVPRSMSMRQAGKKSNHGLNYGEGYREFSLQNEISEAEGKVYVEMYHSVYPGIRHTYHESVKRQLDENRILVNCYDRPYKFLGKMDDHLLNAAYAFKPQSTIADLLNEGIIDTYYDNNMIFTPLEMLTQVHDSILEQYSIKPLPFINIHKLFAAAIIKQCEYLNPELEYNGMKFRIETDMKMGFNWADMEKVKLSNNIKEQERYIRNTLDDIRNKGA